MLTMDYERSCQSLGHLRLLEIFLGIFFVIYIVKNLEIFERKLTIFRQNLEFFRDIFRQGQFLLGEPTRSSWKS